MRHQRLHAFLLSATAALLLALPASSFAAASDCTTMEGYSRNDSYKTNGTDGQGCMFLGWPVPPDWLDHGGQGKGVNAGGSSGFSYGAVKAPESPPGAHGENASVSAAAITQSCNFPPRVTLSISSSSVSFGAGSCLDFMNGVFKDSTGNTASSTPPVGISPADTCPADSNNTGVYGAKTTATGTVPATCGGMVPIATADLTLNANPTSLATTTSGSYYIWTYHKSGTSFAQGLNAVALPTYLCGPQKDKYGLPIKTVDLTAPTEQMITYNANDGTIAIRLQPRATMPATYLPPYSQTDVEKFLVLPLNSSGDPVVPGNCADANTYYKTVSAHQDLLVQSATITGTQCASIVPTIVNYPVCSNGSQPKCGSGDPHTNWVAICNPGNPLPPFTARLLPVNGVCAANSTNSSCTSTANTTDANCDVVSMVVPNSARASCASMQQFSALNRPELFYPAATNAVFSSISGRTQQMAATVAGSRFYMQTNTTVIVQSTAPALLLSEGGNLVQSNGSILLMNSPSTLNPSSGSVTLTNGGQLTDAGGTLLASYNAGATYNIVGTSPYTLHVGRSLTLPTGFLIPTVPTTNSQPPYIQLPVAIAQ